jgi:energy-coupling factor transport system substrate-specific component
MTEHVTGYGSALTPFDTRWRTRDIVVTAVIAVAFGVVFWAWDTVWNVAAPLFGTFKPLEYVISGVWLMPAVMASLIVRKPGAALFAELVAAIMSALLGNVWGMDVVLSGFVQGTGAELVFAFTLYRSFGLPVALLAGGLAGVGEALHDLQVYYPSNGVPFQASVAGLEIASGVAIAGLGGWLLVRALRRAGVLEGFPSDA